jgi:hypothetical protein
LPPIFGAGRTLTVGFAGKLAGAGWGPVLTGVILGINFLLSGSLCSSRGLPRVRLPAKVLGLAALSGVCARPVAWNRAREAREIRGDLPTAGPVIDRHCLLRCSLPHRLSAFVAFGHVRVIGGPFRLRHLNLELVRLPESQRGLVTVVPLIFIITAALSFAAGWLLGCREHKRAWHEGWEQGRTWGLAGRRNRPGEEGAE